MEVELGTIWLCGKIIQVYDMETAQLQEMGPCIPPLPILKLLCSFDPNLIHGVH